METLLAVGTLTFAVVLIVRGEVSIRRLDRLHAREFPLKIDAARTELKIQRHAAALRAHCTDEDLTFLAKNGSADARAQLKARALPPAPVTRECEPKPAVVLPSAKANAFYMKYGYFPWEERLTKGQARAYPRKYT